MTTEEIMKLPFDKRRTELLKAYVKEMKKKYPESTCRVQGASMKVLFPKDKKKYGRISLSGELDGWQYHGWRETHYDTDTQHGYTVSIYPKDTETFMLRPLEKNYRSTDRQRSTLMKALVNHSGCVMECPRDDRWMELISIKRASNLIDALFANHKVAIVYDMTQEEVESYFNDESGTADEPESLLQKELELKRKNDRLYKEREDIIMGCLVPLFNGIHIASGMNGYTITLTIGKDIHSKPCSQPDFMYFKLRNHPENNYNERRLPVRYLAKKYFCDILDEYSAQGTKPFFIYTPDESFMLIYNDVIIDIGSNRDEFEYALNESFKTGECEDDADILIQGGYVHNLVDWNFIGEKFQFRMIGYNERHVIAREFDSRLSGWVTDGNVLHMQLGVFLGTSGKKDYPQNVADYENLMERIVEFEKNRNRKPVCFIERRNKERTTDGVDIVSHTILYFSIDYITCRK